MEGLTINYADGQKSASGGNAAPAPGLMINKPDEGAGIISDRALYWNEDKSKVVEEGDPDTRFVFCGPGCEIKREDAAKYGLKFKGNQLLPRDYVEPEAELPADLDSLKVAELKEVAKDQGVEIPSGALKADIIEAIQTANEPEDLDAMSVIALRELAKNEGVSLTGITAKADIIAAIQLGREAKA